ncbi:MAG: TrkH family potassium uptake protein [Acidimicrobiales bacterium]
MRRRRTWSSTSGFVIARALLACSALLGLSAVVTIFDSGQALLPLALLAAGTGLAGGGLRQVCVPAPTLPARAVHVAVFWGWVVLIGVGALTYLVTGATDVASRALIESTTGFTTTARSVLVDVQDLPRGVLFWRASTQWLGGFAALLVVVGVLPTLGVGGMGAQITSSDRSRLHLRSPRIIAATRRLAVGYASLSVVGIGLFLIAGLGPFDAVTYAMTTISTGGFANHPESISHFDSVLVEWITAGGMALGGTNLVLAFNALRGKVTPLWRSSELRAYLGLILGATFLLTIWVSPSSGITATAFRQSFFAATSALSTTGHTLSAWAGWADGPWSLLILLAAVGAMSGAAGGGFRVIRAMVMVNVVVRETMGQLQPRSVVVIKVGRQPVPEATVAHMVGYQVAWVALAGVGAVGLALTGLELEGSITGATSALATWGPGLGVLAPGGTPSLATIGVMTPLMLAGRLEISPVIIGLSSTFRSATKRRRRRLR